MSKVLSPKSSYILVMATSLTILLAIVFLLSTPVTSQVDEIFYGGFSDVGANLTKTGVAEIDKDGILRLTNETSRLMGHAFHSFPLQFKNSTNGTAFSFSTSFAFAIVPEYPKLGGHGFAFAISPSKELRGALPSQYLGLLNASDIGNFSNHLFAVEFDTVKDFEFEDINDNHSGNTIQAWIDYDSVGNVLNVTLSPSSSKPKLPILSFPLDLSPILQEFMYVGFSASTGKSGTQMSSRHGSSILALIDSPTKNSRKPPKDSETRSYLGMADSAEFTEERCLIPRPKLLYGNLMLLSRTGKATTNSDVFAFGALLLEVTCGRRPIEAKALPEELVLVDWVWDKWTEGRILEAVDSTLTGQYDEGEVVMVLKLGLLCSSYSPTARPSMRQVVRYLEGEKDHIKNYFRIDPKLRLVQPKSCSFVVLFTLEQIQVVIVSDHRNKFLPIYLNFLFSFSQPQDLEFLAKWNILMALVYNIPFFNSMTESSVLDEIMAPKSCIMGSFSFRKIA
ncbi:unnamed protein product, partial [Vitis vinifera]